MQTDIQRIIIIRHRKPRRNNINDELQWFGASLGLFGLRDRDKSTFRIFIELLKSAKQDKAVSSDELALNLKLTRGTVIHHMNKLLESGLVTTQKKRYRLRVDNLQALIDELDKDADRIFEDLKEVAQDIDQWVGL